MIIVGFIHSTLQLSEVAVVFAIPLDQLALNQDIGKRGPGIPTRKMGCN